MKISISYEVDQFELDSFHDCVYDVTGKSLSNKDLLRLFETLPRHMRALAVEWGMSDTVFLDQAYEYLQAQKEK